MAGKAKYDDALGGADNQFVRDALRVSGMTQESLGRELETRKLGSYPKMKVSRMTRTQKVRAVEIAAISKITGVPIPEEVTIDAMRAEISEIVKILETWPPDTIEAARPVIYTLGNFPSERFQDVRVMLDAFLGKPTAVPPPETHGSDTP